MDQPTNCPVPSQIHVFSRVEHPNMVYIDTYCGLCSGKKGLRQQDSFTIGGEASLGLQQHSNADG